MTAAVATRYRFGRFELLPAERQLLADGAPMHLGAHAFDLLVALVERSGHLVTKDELLELVWPRVVVGENTLQVHVSALRKVLGADAIVTVAGRGYRFVLEATRDVEPTSPATARKHNLPNQVTSFIGREKEIEEVKQLLSTARLLTLTGAGGCGKTRLVLQSARGVLDRFPDGVWLAELAPLDDAKHVPQAVADALGVKDEAGRPLIDTLGQWLGTRHLLLLLDNAEHVLGACARLVDDLLRRCERLSIVITSRERLGIGGELTYRVPSLSVPNDDATSGEALGCEAARLFIERARLQRPDFEITERDSAALASICRRLDGIALAIELAAPRVRHMSIDEVSRRLEHRFGLLTGGSRTALPRHRTLRSLINWSYDLLDESEQQLLQRASVFSGGWTLAAAEHVCSGHGIDRGRVLDLLTSLADKSLVVTEMHGDGTRFGMLETVRHYALDVLRDVGDEATVRGRHVEHFLAIAEELDAAPDDQARNRLLRQLDGELDNLRAAMAWCEAAASRSAMGLKLVGKLYWLWYTSGPTGEARQWVARLLAVTSATPATPANEHDEDRARALHIAGSLARAQSDYGAAEKHHHEALAIWRALGDRRQMLRSIGSLGNVAFERNDLPAARAAFQEALAISRELDDRRTISIGLLNLAGIHLLEDDLAKAQELLEESVAMSRDIGPHAAGVASARLGWIRHWQGDSRHARTLLTQAVEAFREFKDHGGLGLTLAWLGTVCADERDFAAAKAYLREALEVMQALRHRMGMTDALKAVAGLSLALGNPLAAAQLWGAELRVRDEIGEPLEAVAPILRRRYESQVAEARKLLQDRAAFERSLNEGRSLTMDEAVRCAIEQLQ